MNGVVDVFVTDQLLGTAVRVSTGPGGREARKTRIQPWISRDADKVGFITRDDALTPGDRMARSSDVHLHDVATGATVLVTADS